MQHVHRRGETGNINYSKSTRIILNSDFADAFTNRFHGFPVVWVATPLHLVNLKSGLLSRRRWKAAKILKSGTHKLDWFKVVHKGGLYNILYVLARDDYCIHARANISADQLKALKYLAKELLTPEELQRQSINRSH